MTAEPSLADLVEEERHGEKREEQRRKQRERSRRISQWSKNLREAWDHYWGCIYLTDDELLWLIKVTAAAHAEGGRKSTNPWTGNTRTIYRPPSAEDAAKLEKLVREMGQRKDQADRDRERRERQAFGERLHRLGITNPYELQYPYDIEVDDGG